MRGHSHDEGEDVIVAVEAALPIGTDIEDLGELEGILVVHAEGASHKDEHAAVEGALLDILAVDLVLDVLEAERLNLVPNLVDALVHASVVAHRAVLRVEVQQVSPVLHQCPVVSLQELLSQRVHQTLSQQL